MAIAPILRGIFTYTVQVGSLPIIAGKADGCFTNEEVHIFNVQFRAEIESRICHPVRIAVLTDGGQSKCIRFKGIPVSEKIKRMRFEANLKIQQLLAGK